MHSEMLNTAVCKFELFVVLLFIYLRSSAYGVICSSGNCKALELLICNVCVD
jgi:hypothetical protein